MKVMQINSYSNGSTGRIANAIHTSLLQNGDQSILAYGNGPDIPNGGYRISSNLGMYVHNVLSLFTGLHGYTSFISTIKLIKKIKSFNPDIVHLHNLHGGYVNFITLLKYLGKHDIKTVMTVHDCWIYTGKCYHYYEVDCKRYLDKCGNCPQLAMYPKSYFFDFTKKMLRDKRRAFSKIKNLNIVTISEWSKQQVQETMLSKYPVAIIRNGVDPAFRFIDSKTIASLDEKIGNCFVILGVAASWNTNKGINDFIELAKKLKGDEIIILVGGLKKEINLPDNIISIKRTDNIQELATLYNRADVYVSASTQETYGLTIAEALSCGTPAIVYDATACREMINPGENGYFVRPHDIDELYDRITYIRKSSNIDREKISLEAKQKFSADKMIENYISLYRKIFE
jgi:putative colanic acid biosynthesis glycosyltransferase